MKSHYIKYAITLIACLLIVGAFILVNNDNKVNEKSPETSSAVAIENNKDGNGTSKSDKNDTSKEEPEPQIDTSAWNLILVNPTNKLPEDYSVELTQLDNGRKVDSRIYDDLEKMISDMESADLSPYIRSAYRTAVDQRVLYENEVKDYLSKGYSQAEAEKEAAKWVAIPRTSEHEAGLALDIVDRSYTALDEKQEDTAVQKWLMKNSWKYGFILRYPNDKKEITGINYEPWHYRYVGKEAAKAIYEKGICLEEYLGKVE